MSTAIERSVASKYDPENIVESRIAPGVSEMRSLLPLATFSAVTPAVITATISRQLATVISTRSRPTLEVCVDDLRLGEVAIGEVHALEVTTLDLRRLRGQERRSERG